MCGLVTSAKVFYNQGKNLLIKALETASILFQTLSTKPRGNEGEEYMQIYEKLSAVL